jgi:hypothetical protein
MLGARLPGASGLVAGVEKRNGCPVCRRRRASGARSCDRLERNVMLELWKGKKMKDWELLKKIKETSFFIDGERTSLSKISSFSVGRAGDAPTDEEIRANGIKRNCILLGLNPSDVLEIDWGNFHIKANSKKHSPSFDHRIYKFVEMFPVLSGIYMTDLGKGQIDADSSSFVKYFTTNEAYRNKCFECLDAELDLFGEDPLIICMHSRLEGLLNKYGRRKYNTVRVYHYSYTRNGCRNDEKFFAVATPSWKEAAEKVAGLEKHKS